MDKSMRSIDDETRKLQQSGKSFDQARLKSADRFATTVITNIYNQFAGAAPESWRGLAKDKAGAIVESFSKLDQTIYHPMHPALKVNMKSEAYMTVLNFLRKADAEPADLLYNELMSRLKDKDQRTYAGLIKGGFPAMV